MKKQAQVYYNAASLKLSQASEMNRKKVLQAKKYYDCGRLYYTAAARKFDKAAKLDKENVGPNCQESGKTERKAALKAREALKKQMKSKKTKNQEKV